MEPAVARRDLLQRVRSWHRLPALRLDLRLVRGRDGKTFRLCDPRTQQFVELYELECLVAQALDGDRSLEELTLVARSYNPTIQPAAVESLVVQLLHIGLLEEPPEPTKPGHGKVIPLPSAVTDEFAAFRNEVVRDLHREEGLRWAEVTNPGPRRAPFFIEQRFVDDDLGDNTNIAPAGDPFKVLEQSRNQMVANGETEDDTVLGSGDFDDLTPAPAPPPRAPESFKSGSSEDVDVEAPASPQMTPQAVASESEELWQSSKSETPRWWKRRSLRVLALLAVVLIGAGVIHHPLYVTAECSIVPADRAYVRAPISGVIAEILVEEGSPVKKGDVLVRLDDRDLAAEKRKAEAELERTHAELERLHHGARPEEISQAKSVLSGRLTAVSFAQKEASRRSKMFSDGVGSKQALDQAQLDLQVKQNAASEAGAALRLLQAGTRVEEVAAYEATLKRAQADLDFINQKLNDMVVIRAPISGVVLTPKFHERMREHVEAGGLVCEIADTATVRAEIYVPEREADTVAIGMPVTVKVESYPLHPFTGKVEFIAPSVEQRDKVNVVRVVSRLNNLDGMLRQDMTGYGEVEAGDRTLLNLATRRLLRWVRVRFLL